jgi:hypothetical protein
MEILTLMTKAGEQVRTADYLGLINHCLYMTEKCFCCGSTANRVIVILWEGCLVAQCAECKGVYQVLWFRVFDKLGCWKPGMTNYTTYPISLNECASIAGFPVWAFDANLDDSWVEDVQIASKFASFG